MLYPSPPGGPDHSDISSTSLGLPCDVTKLDASTKYVEVYKHTGKRTEIKIFIKRN